MTSVNTSLKTGSIDIDGAKLAYLTPLMKVQSLDSSNMKNYCPRSNLSFISKLAKRVVLKQLTEHLDAQNLNISYQYGYKKHHSTETFYVRQTHSEKLFTVQKHCMRILNGDKQAHLENFKTCCRTRPFNMQKLGAD